MKFEKCKICRVGHIDHQQVFLTEDKHCTVCNHKFRDRVRPRPYFDFKYDSDNNKYENMTHRGTRVTNDYIVKQKMLKENNPMTLGKAIYDYNKNKNSKIDRWLEK